MSLNGRYDVGRPFTAAELDEPPDREDRVLNEEKRIEKDGAKEHVAKYGPVAIAALRFAWDLATSLIGQHRH